MRIRVTTAALNPVVFDPAAFASGALARIGAIDFASHRGAMLRFARRKIRDEDLAEDAVQDALVAALAARESFQGKSALRTWLFGILNHKIQDVFRRESRYVRPSTPEPGDGDSLEESMPQTLAALDAAAETDPSREVARRRMHEVLAREIEALPPTLREVFRMQVIEGLPTDEVCRRLGITEANCWVRLHRARKRLAERMRDHLE